MQWQTAVLPLPGAKAVLPFCVSKYARQNTSLKQNVKMSKWWEKKLIVLTVKVKWISLLSNWKLCVLTITRSFDVLPLFAWLLSGYSSFFPTVHRHPAVGVMLMVVCVSVKPAPGWWPVQSVPASRPMVAQMAPAWMDGVLTTVRYMHAY